MNDSQIAVAEFTRRILQKITEHSARSMQATSDFLEEDMAGPVLDRERRYGYSSGQVQAIATVREYIIDTLIEINTELEVMTDGRQKDWIKSNGDSNDRELAKGCAGGSEPEQHDDF